MYTGTRRIYTKLYCEANEQGAGEPTESFTGMHVCRDQENLHKALRGCVYVGTRRNYRKLYCKA